MLLYHRTAMLDAIAPRSRTLTLAFQSISSSFERSGCCSNTSSSYVILGLRLLVVLWLFVLVSVTAANKCMTMDGPRDEAC